MNGRERLLATFRREKVDRVPISPFLNYNCVYELFGYVPDIDSYTDPSDFDLIEKYVEYCDHFGFDVMHIFGTPFDAFNMLNLRGDRTVFRPWDNWDVMTVEERRGDALRRTLTIHTPEGELRQVDNFQRSSTYIVVWATHEHLIKTPADFELFRKYAPPLDEVDVRPVRRAREATGDKGIVVSCIGGAFNTLNVFRKLDAMLLDPLVDEGFYREMVEYFLGWTIQRMRKIVATGAADVIEIGANLATSAVGPGFYTNYVLEYEQRLIDEIHQAGAFALFHNCGDAAKIMHLYNQTGMDCWGYLTPPPYGDVVLAEALRVMRPDMVLRGNVDQVEFLAKATPAEVKARVRDLLLQVKPRGNWILSTTDWWFDGLPYANVEAFVEAGLEYGGY